MEIPDAAVEAAAKAACEATYPPSPSGRVKVHDSWEEVEEWERDAWRATARAALVAARPYLMPTREQIAEALHDNDHAHSWRQEGVCSRYACEHVYPPMADVVLALLNGAESEPECDCRYGHQPQYTKHEHTCSWGRWHLVQQAWNGAES